VNPVPADALETLGRQTRRLEFANPEWERRFHEERQAQGLTRARVMMFCGLIAVDVLGWVDAAINATRSPEFASHSLVLRFGVITPVWLLMVAASYLRPPTVRVELIYSVGTVAIAWVLGLLPWLSAQYFPQVVVAQHVGINLVAVYFTSAVALPLRFRAIAATVLLSGAGVVALFVGTLPLVRQSDVMIVTGIIVLIGALVLAMSWYREAGERLMFGQREQVRELNAELARLNAEKNEFMAIASHDLRAPLASVRGLAEMLRAGSLREPAKQAEAHAAIHDAAGRMLGLVNDYLGAHAMETGMLPMTLGRLDLQAVANETAGRHASSAAAKGQRIEVTAGPVADVRADAALLAQVADNFVTNAMKFSPAGTTVKIGIAVAEDGSVARFEVTDDGPGIAPEEQAALFQKFSRASTRPTAGETSHGLGLAVAKRLAETMGGRVGCESGPGNGATFWIELPAA